MGAGVAAAVLGTLAGLFVFRRRKALDPAPASPAKLRSLYANEIAVAASTSLPSTCRRGSVRASPRKGGRSDSGQSAAAQRLQVGCERCKCVWCALGGLG